MSLKGWARRASGLLLPQLSFANTNKLGPGCCCTPAACEILNDDFQRADSTNIGSDWTESAGSWEIATNQLQVTSANARCLAVPTHTDANVKITVEVTFSAIGQVARLLFNYVDTSNYDYAEFKCGTSQAFKMVRRAGGVETEISNGVTFTDSTTSFVYIWTACFNVAGGFGNTVAGLPSGGYAAAGTSGVFGLATGAMPSGNIRFNNFVAEVVSDECVECVITQLGCVDICADSRAPVEYVIEASGIVNDDCADCGDFNGAFETGPSSADCTRGTTYVDDCRCRAAANTDNVCGFNNWEWIAGLVENGSGDWFLLASVRQYNSIGGEVAALRFWEPLTYPANCLFDGLELTNKEAVTTLGVTPCDVSAATCFVSLR